MTSISSGKSLPERPDVEQLKKQAKELLEGVHDGRTEALNRCGNENTVDFALSDAQRVLAREYGFPSWARLKLHVETRTEETAEARLIDAVIQGDRDGMERILAERPLLRRRGLYVAAALGDAEEVCARIGREPELARTKSGPRNWEPLLYVCFGCVGGDDAERAQAVRTLLSAGADANAFWIDPIWPDSPQAALYGAVGVNDYPGVAEALLTAGANPLDGESIYHAAEQFHRRSLDVLAAFGADFSARQSPWGNTPLYFNFGHTPDMPTAGPGIRWLLEHRADPNVTSGELRETALHAAARNGWDAAMMTLLLACGANPALKRTDGRTALALAVRAGNTEAERALREAATGPDGGTLEPVGAVDEFLGACRRADGDRVRTLLRDHPGLVAGLTEAERRSALDAAASGKPESLLIMKEAGMDLTVEGAHGETPLHIAAWRGHREAVRVLIAAGAALDKADRMFSAPPFGWCAHGSMHCPQKGGGDYAGVATALIEAGAAVPKGTEASREVMAVIRERRGR